MDILQQLSKGGVAEEDGKSMEVDIGEEIKREVDEEKEGQEEYEDGEDKEDDGEDKEDDEEVETEEEDEEVDEELEDEEEDGTRYGKDHWLWPSHRRKTMKQKAPTKPLSFLL